MFVEVDIILPPDMSLKEAHDIGEALQKGVCVCVCVFNHSYTVADHAE